MTVPAADQAFSGASNLIVVLLIARSTSTDGFAQFLVSWVVLVFILTLSRSTLSVHISLSAADPSEVTYQTRHATAFVLLTTPLIFGAIALAPVISVGSSSPATLLLALLGPLVLVQDVLRHKCFALAEPTRVLAADGIWLVFVFGAGAVSIWGEPSAVWMLLLWGAGALVGLCAMAPWQSSPRFSGLGVWFKSSVSGKPALTSSGVIAASAVAISTILIGRLADAEVVAAMGGAAQLLSPINTLLGLTAIWVLPRAMTRTPAARRQLFLLLAVSISAVAVVWTLILLSLPNSWGQVFLGENWTAARNILLLTGIQFSIGVFAISFATALRSLHLFTSALVESTVLAIARILNAVLGSVLIGTAAGIVTGNIVVMATGAILSWVMVSRGVAKERAVTA